MTPICTPGTQRIVQNTTLQQPYGNVPHVTTIAGEMPEVMTSAMPTRQVTVDLQQKRLNDELDTKDHQYHKLTPTKVQVPAA